MKIQFSLPYIDEDVLIEMHHTLTKSGWITSGPKVIELENEIKIFTGSQNVLCVNSWTSGAMLILKWFGIGVGDEVIIPSYSYSATALAVMNIGAKPIMVDVDNDFNINVNKVLDAITINTKAIIPVDIGGWPCNYNEIYHIINSPSAKSLFRPKCEKQSILGRILLLADAAHSFGAIYNGKVIGNVADVTIFSLHSVKNITTGEGGAICLNLPVNFDHEIEYKYLKSFSLNGQSKTAYEKNQPGGWKYDIISQGLKINMPDICASIGLAQIRKYSSKLLPERKKIFRYYNEIFAECPWAVLPETSKATSESSYHLYMLRIKDFNEYQRDQLIAHISEQEIGVNVHYIPMAMLTLFKNNGYNIENYPVTYDLYRNEISLPVYNGLTQEQLEAVTETVIKSYYKTKKY
jgi:dTDP-4-amino-4,6-dideoxygalactose transaminase